LVATSFSDGCVLARGLRHFVHLGPYDDLGVAAVVMAMSAAIVQWRFIVFSWAAVKQAVFQRGCTIASQRPKREDEVARWALSVESRDRRHVMTRDNNVSTHDS